MGTSTQPAFKAALMARLQADSGLTGVLVSWGLPPAPNRQLPKEWVFLGATRNDDPTGTGQGGQKTANFGQRAREERYVQEVVVVVLGGVLEDQAVISARAYAIAAVIENSMRSWQALATPISGITRWALVTGLYHQEGVTNDTRERFCNVFIDLAQSARI